MFQRNEYACFAYEVDGIMDIAEGNILDVDNDSIVIAYNNVRGPATPTRVLLNTIVDIF
jgi:hypothetical protein